MSFRIGADYYPEHWPRERWEIDAQMMQEAEFNVTRLAEFSWAKLEPREGVYDFAWLDEAIGILGRYGVSSILGTPTPTIPKWMADRYPDIIVKDQQGHAVPFGNRQMTCFSSELFREKSREITRMMAEHYAENPDVIGFQLDNELFGPHCYCDACERKFQQWLHKKYQTIEKLNESYGTIFWSHCYSDFSELHLPRHPNSSPSLDLDYRRFHSENVVSFAKEQADILRECCPGKAITHNLMGFASDVNYFDLGELLDFVSFDYYYNFGDDTWEDRYNSYLSGAASLDLMRGIKRKNFWLMENSAGTLGWETYGRNIRPGELRRMTYQNIAHGADGQVWFRWRTSRFGTEQYWHGLLGHDGLGGRRYQEAAQVSNELHTLFQELEGSRVEAKVGLLLDYEDRWAFDLQKNSDHFSYCGAFMPYYRALARRGVNVDFINVQQPLDSYRVLVLSTKYLLNEELAERLRIFVQNGGVLLTTCRTGVKNECNVPYAMTLPGYLREVLGVRVEEYEAVSPKHPYTVQYENTTYQGNILADWVIPESALSLAEYQEEGLEAYSAITVNDFGKGRAYYVGTIPEDRLAQELMDQVLNDAGISPFEIPEQVEVSIRSKQGVDYVFVLNHTSQPQAIGVSGKNLLTGKQVEQGFSLEANGVAVLKRWPDR